MSAGRHVNTCLPTTDCFAGIGEGAQAPDSVAYIFSAFLFSSLLCISLHFSEFFCTFLTFSEFHCISLNFYAFLERRPVVLWTPFLLCKYYPLYSFWLFETLNKQHVIHYSKTQRNFCDPDNSWLWCAEFPWCAKDLANHKSLYNLQWNIQFWDDYIFTSNTT